jgi:superoxide dismutase, Fe-Mn family
MIPFTQKTFTLPPIEGISEKTMTTHLKLYEGYVKQANVILDKIEEYSKDPEANAYALGELQRRFAFEFDGMRNHEYYFMLLEDGPRPLPADGALAKTITETWGSVDAFLARFRSLALTRGIGWAMLLYDKHTDRLLTQWVDEQHLGHLTGLMPILPLDVWEHAYLLDYAPAEKAKYVDAYLKAMNWETANDWFENVRT